MVLLLCLVKVEEFLVEYDGVPSVCERGGGWGPLVRTRTSGVKTEKVLRYIDLSK